MKKALLFLLLFGGGLALLFYLQEEEPDPVEPLEIDTTEEVEPEQDGGIKIPIRNEDGTEGTGFLTVFLEGKYKLIHDRKSESGPHVKIYEFNTDNFHSAKDSSIVADDDKLIIFDPVDGAIRAELTANRAYLDLEADASGKIRISSNKPARLENVDLTILSGAPLTPIEFHVPTLDWTRADGAFESEDRVVLESPGVAAVGTGMRIVTVEGRESITLKRAATMEFDLENGQKATLESLGLSPLVLSRKLSESGDHVRLTIDDGAKLTLPEGRVLNSQSLTVEGERVYTTDESGIETGEFVLTKVEALGQVSFESAQGRLLGSEANLEFDAAGKPLQLTLSGSPSAEIAVETAPNVVANLSIEGAGPLRLRMGSRGRFDFSGPAVVNWPAEGLVVSAKDWIRGSYDEAAKQTEITAQGAVEITHPEGSLSGSSLVITHKQESKDLATARIVVQGPSVFTGTDEAGRKLIVEAAGELIARTRREANESRSEIILERVKDVTVRLETPVENEKNFTASSGVLRDLDPRQRTFIAENGVVYEIDGIVAKGHRVVARSDQDFDLFGAADVPATIEATGGTQRFASLDAVTISAGYIHFTPQVVTATTDIEILLPSADREFRARADEVRFEWLAEESADGAPRPYRLTANGIDEAGLQEAEQEFLLSCEALEIEGSIGEELGPFELQADGNVRVEAQGKERELSTQIAGSSSLVGMGERFVWSVTVEDLAAAKGNPSLGSGRGKLTTDRGKRVRSVGNLAGERLPYEMSADWIEFDAENIRSANPLLRIDSTNLPTSQGPGTTDESQVFQASAEMLVATRNYVRLIDDVVLTGESTSSYAWDMEADRVEIRFDPEGSTKSTTLSPVPSALKSVIAEGNLTVEFNDELRGTGDRMVATNETLRLEGRPAHLETAAFAWESGWTEFSFIDESITTGPGLIVPREDDAGPDWKVRYESLQPFQEGEVTVLALRNVLVTQDEKTLRSNWALFWIDNEERQKADNPLMGRESSLRTDQVSAHDEEKPEATKTQFAPFQGMRDSSLARILNELYVEGDVEYLVDTQRLVRADALYVDLVEGHSWIQGADLVMETPETKGESLRVKAKWIRHSEDGSLRAEDATVTSCNHDVPHYVIEVSNLRMIPISDPKSDNLYQISLKKNSLRFTNGVRIPLPTTGIESDAEGQLDLRTLTIGSFRVPNVTFGSSNKFGPTVGTNFSRSFGRLGSLISDSTERLLNLKSDSIRGSWNYNATWFGSRGLMLGLGFDMSDNEDFFLQAQADGILDRRRDRGLVRVDRADRSTFRGWYRARGRYYLNKEQDEWLDFRFTHQTDAGVQAEFFEREFIAFEERETFVHWRKAKDQFFYAATVEAEPAAHLTEIQDLPAVMAQRGRTPVGMIGKTPLMYSATADFDYLRRHAGSQEVGFNDGLSGPTVARFDTKHRFEAPMNVGETDVKMTPFIEGRGTVWNRSQAGPDDPLRASLTGGGEFSLALWKRQSGDRIHILAPKLGSRVTMGVDESGGLPIFFDEVEEPVQGHFVDAGIRSIWRGPDPNRYVDLDVTMTHASDVPAHLNGWTTRTYALIRNYLLGMPAALIHDARYDLDDSRTDYSRTFFGLKPWERLELGTGYNSGRANQITVIDERLYETASISARFQATPKWDLEFRQVFNLKGVEDLETSFLIRRFGHDALFELEIRDRAGEGTGFSIGVRPRIGWKRSTLGLFRD